jgi:predicted negative regulator of RcsB-dependent stress response
MLQAFSAPALSPEQLKIAQQLAEQLKADYAGSTYAQFAALHLARVAVGDNDLAGAQAELRWVLSKADKGSDIASIAQLRLARVLAASGESEQALAILDEGAAGAYRASYGVARGDILLSLGRAQEASEAYSSALALAGEGGADIGLGSVQEKLRALNPKPARASAAAGSAAVAAPATGTGQSAEAVEGASTGEEG